LLRRNHDHWSFISFHLPDRPASRYSIQPCLVVLEYHQSRTIRADEVSRFINGGKKIETNALGTDDFREHRRQIGISDTKKDGPFRQRRVYGRRCWKLCRRAFGGFGAGRLNLNDITFACSENLQRTRGGL